MATPFRLIDRIAAVATATPHRVAYVDVRTGEALRYVELRDAIAAASAVAREGRGPVVLRHGNRVDFAARLLGPLAAGRDVFPVHPNSTTAEISALVGRAAKVPPTGALLLASSGTTGVPKVVRRSAASLDAVAAAMVEAIGFTAADHVLAGVPLSHSYGLEHGLLAPLWAGATVHLCDGLDVPSMHAALAGPVTVFPAVPPMIELLATLADAPAAMPNLRAVYSAGGPLATGIAERFAARFGRRVGQVYGMTEIGSVTYADVDSPAFVAASVGRPMAGVSVRVTDGEIAVRAESMFDGYIDDSAPLVDGHFLTGDLGHVDAACNVVITGRTRLLIDVGGIKVNPLEIEAVFRDHPGVADCVVVPVRQSETVARLRAVVVPKAAAVEPTPDSLRQFARDRLAPFKVPRVIECRATLPRSPAGKILRDVVETD